MMNNTSAHIPCAGTICIFSRSELAREMIRKLAGSYEKRFLSDFHKIYDRARLLQIGLLGVLCVVPCVAEEFPDPTRPPSVAAGATVAAPAIKSGLESIIIAKYRRAAILDGQTVELGAMHGDAKLIEVAPDRVVLQGAHGRQVLLLFPDVKMTGKHVQLPAKKPGTQKDQ